MEALGTRMDILEAAVKVQVAPAFRWILQILPPTPWRISYMG